MEETVSNLEARVSQMFVTDNYVSLQKDKVFHDNPEVLADLIYQKALASAQYLFDCMKLEAIKEEDNER